MPQVAKPTKIEPGILSCLTSLNIDDVSQYKEKETPTPSGIAECKINIMKMLDDSVSSKPIMQKTAESTNCKNSNKERTSFSTYIKQNSFNDTSNMYFNINGQICFEFAVLWFFLMPAAIWLEDFVRWTFWKEGKKYGLKDVYMEFLGLK